MTTDFSHLPTVLTGSASDGLGFSAMSFTIEIPLFGRFHGTMGMSDCHGSSIAAVRLWASRRGPVDDDDRATRGSPGFRA